MNRYTIMINTYEQGTVQIALQEVLDNNTVAEITLIDSWNAEDKQTLFCDKENYEKLKNFI